ncbi:MAG: glycosyltransferase family 4 protein [Janthinobacterium lividum]
MRIVIDLQTCQGVSAYRGMGRYSLSLAQEMVRQGAGRGHEMWLALNDNNVASIHTIVAAFEGALPAERIAIFSGMAPVAGMVKENEWRTRAAEFLRERFLAQLNADVVHLASIFDGSIDEVVTSVGAGRMELPVVITHYDLIPLLMRKEYMVQEDAERFWMKKFESLRRAPFMLAISEGTKSNAIEFIGVDPEKIVNISAAVAPMFKPRAHLPEEAQAVLGRYGIVKPFVLYVPGGYDARKNFKHLFEAWAKLPAAIRLTHQLVIGSKSHLKEYAIVRALMRSAGLPDEDVVFTGYLPDDDLISMYSLCDLHVFPSLLEGFGLPVLEALACGAPSLASNTSSMPEIIGREDALMDPHNPDDIAEKITRGLTDHPYRESLREHAVQQAAKFSWERSASLALDALERFFPPGSARRYDRQSAEDWMAGILDELAAIEISVEPTSLDLELLRESVAKSASALDSLKI